MIVRRRLIVALLISIIPASAALVLACCPAPPSGRPVVNADQTVVILWDAATKTQHFIRQASFKSDADDFGFLIPSPTQPELNESGDGVFPVLATLTAPKVKTVPRPTGGGSGCSDNSQRTASIGSHVNVLDDKIVAGFHAVVLETRSSEDLVEWLKSNGYAFSPQIQAWATPYVEQGWKITALKVAKPKPGEPTTAPATATADATKNVSAAALRMSFKTDRPLFPYREPDPKAPAWQLGANHRLLRIYFIADARYQGIMAGEPSGRTPSQEKWTGTAVWSGKVAASDRTRAIELLKLRDTDGPAEWWLTEFEDNWPYRAAPGDVYFSRSADQSMLERDPILQYAAATSLHLAEAAPYVLVVAAVGLMPIFRRLTGRRDT